MRNGLADQSKMLPVRSGLEGDDVIKSSYEERGVGGSSPSSLTKFPATHTPPHVARMMCEALCIKPTDRVLEPSAGYGDMVSVIREFTTDVVAIELGSDRFNVLQRMSGLEVYKRDFLRLTPDSANVSMRGIALRLNKFSKIIMCPPANSDDHITHALSFLRPGGKLMALVQERNVTQWRSRYKPLRERFEYKGEDIPCGTITVQARSAW